jgi:hypothetical protein
VELDELLALRLEPVHPPSTVPKLVKSELLAISANWLNAARTLHASQPASAYHLGGIALECALKARIASRTVAEEFPDKRLVERSWNHDPSTLLAAGELQSALDSAPSLLQANWAVVKDWKVESRYDLQVPSQTVTDFLDALDDPTNGIITWLRNHC